tara:strand:+ start:1009 stop:1365 length:357 start_codon:yes stop_codon:yes gene_type:complete
MNDIYLLEFEPHLLSHKQEELGLVFADLDTAVDLMKKEEKVLIAELTLYYVEKGGYKNMTELNGHIYSDKKFKDYFDRYKVTLKQRNQAKIRFESFKVFVDNIRTKAVNDREMVKKHL